MSIELETLIAYWIGELSDAENDRVEEALFSDAEVARRLAAIEGLSAGLRGLLGAGGFAGTVGESSVEAMRAAGITLREYDITPGQRVPCGYPIEDAVVVRLNLAGLWKDDASTRASFPIDVDFAGTLEGAGEILERVENVVVDPAGPTVVFVYPGERIRALPRSRFEFTVRAGEQELARFGMDHDPQRR